MIRKHYIKSVRGLFGILWLLVAANSIAQADPYIDPTTSDENYILTRSFHKSGLTTFISSQANGQGVLENDLIENITYFDGLGRPMQEQALKASLSNSDIITHMEYDALGRMEKEFLPFRDAGTSGGYRTNGLSATNSYYNTYYPNDINSGNPNPFSQKEYDNSPLNRVMKQAAPGEAWQSGSGHEIVFDYDTNATNEVRFYEVTFTGGNTESPTLTTNGHYAATALLKNVIKDENHNGTSSKLHTTEEFVDGLGRIVLRRTYALLSGVEEEHDTFYVYDAYGNLTFVLPPKADAQDGLPNSTEISELCYQYVYDFRNRLVEKKLPGKGWESIVYNKLDLPVLSQDTNLDAANIWLFTKYDVHGRVAYTGTISHSGTRDYLQGLASSNNYSSQYEVRASGTTIGGTTVHYTNNTIPTGVGETYTINYYDSYVDTDGLSVPSTVLGQPKATDTQGLSTVNKVKVLGTSDWVTTITGYDQKGRVIYTASKNNYLNTTHIVETQLDFGGKALKVRTSHTRNGSTIVTLDNYTYDPVGRVLTQTQCIGDQTLVDDCNQANGTDIVSLSGNVNTVQEAPLSFVVLPSATILPGAELSIDPAATQNTEEMIFFNDYNLLGQLRAKKVGGTLGNDYNNTDGLQTVDYDYNIRGWLTDINNGDTANGDLFGFEINYTDTQYGGAPLYNGNIAETAWKTANDNTLRRYRYEYDALNRIKLAAFNLGNNSQPNRYSTSNITYDKNGNLLGLTRKGHTNSGATSFGNMDVLTYQYYNGGNFLTHLNDSGSDTYGFVDGTNTDADYGRDYNGNTIRDKNKGITSIAYNHLNMPTQITVTGANAGVLSYVYDATGVKLQKTSTPGQSVDYLSNYIYENNLLQHLSHPEGYTEPDGVGGYLYVYYYVDNLDNVRLSYADLNGDGAINTSFEILSERNFYPFGLQHKGYNSVISETENNYFTFQGKEHQKELGLEWYDFELRNYDAATARWFNLDPKADAVDLIGSSPYSFALNNPITFRDPEGDCPPGVICIPAVWDAAISFASSASAKIDRANHIASGMVETFDKADKITGGDGVSGLRKASIYASRYIKEFGDFTSANDVSVLKEGRNLSGQEASTADYTFAVAAVLLPISGNSLKQVFKGAGKWMNAGESMSAAAASFQKQITGVDAGQSFKLNGVKFDGVGANSAGETILLDAKSGMSNFVDDAGNFKGFFTGTDDIISQANRQINAAGGTAIQWHFENKKVMKAYQNLFEQQGIQGIDLIHTPRK